MALFALVNTSAGSVPEDAEARLGARFGPGVAAVIACTGATLQEALSDLSLRPRDVLIVWGGDGTVAAAMTALAGSGASVLPLPGGTMNLLHRRVHGAAGAWDTTLEAALERNETEALTYATAGGRPLYVGLMLGRLTHLAEAREALREAAPLDAARKALNGDALDLTTGLTASLGAERLPATAAAAFLPEGLDGDALDIGLIDPDTLGDLAATGLDALLTDWREANGLVFRKAASAAFSARGDTPLDALLDGERARLASPITVRLRRGDVLVNTARLAPA